jgi:hypothetical protein
MLKAGNPKTVRTRGVKQVFKGEVSDILWLMQGK